MNKIVPNWLLGLTQALLVFSLSFLLYVFFQRVMPINNGLFYRGSSTTNFAFTSTLWAVSALTTVLIYFLAVFFVPLYFFVTRRGLVGLKILAYTAVFLILFITVAEVAILVLYRNLPESQSKKINQNYPNLYTTPMYIAPEDAIRKSEQARRDSELMMEQYIKESKDGPKLKEINLEIEPKIYPYAIDINTGERTLINP